ncbi:hypothetical protein ACFU6R_10730 [Streptomyces sp. NPDC057499]|uniref:hypothetical protein n=1 Tax=Streptomyces sp. NPDC057499 TaxID=3346150 RepID=UPI0036BDCA98
MPVLLLPTGKALTVRTAADAFLDSLTDPNTVRNYGIALGKTAEHLGEGRPLAAVADDEIGGALELLWGSSAVNTWNARCGAVLSWTGWCAERGYDGPAVPAWAKRLPPPDSDTPVRSKMAIDRLIARRDVHPREKTLWRMLYETCARSEEILDVNIEDLDLAGRRAPVKSKGAKPKVRRRGTVRADYVLETVFWDAGTARLLPRLLKGRTLGIQLHAGLQQPFGVLGGMSVRLDGLLSGQFQSEGLLLVSGSQGVDRDAQVEPDSRPGCHADNNVHRFEPEFLDLTSLGTHVTKDLHGLLGDRRGNPEMDLLKLGPRFEPDHKVVIRTGHTATLLY